MGVVYNPVGLSLTPATSDESAIRSAVAAVLSPEPKHLVLAPFVETHPDPVHDRRAVPSGCFGQLSFGFFDSVPDQLEMWV